MPNAPALSRLLLAAPLTSASLPPAAHAVQQGTPKSIQPSSLSGWPQHSRARPVPRVVAPAAPAFSAPPADAIVLVGGTDLSAWVHGDGTSPRWRVVGNAVEVTPGSGVLVMRDSVGDVQLHVEWMSPDPPQGEDQDRGNSGVCFGGGRDEVQILDSYRSITYADGQAGALYGQFPPLVNASRAPGEWQSYDITYRRPRFAASGRLLSPAIFTVFLNGVLIHDNRRLVGPTANGSRPPYVAHEDRLPISLQDHAHPVRFRNV